MKPREHAAALRDLCAVPGGERAGRPGVDINDVGEARSPAGCDVRGMDGADPSGAELCKSDHGLPSNAGHRARLVAVRMTPYCRPQRQWRFRRGIIRMSVDSLADRFEAACAIAREAGELARRLFVGRKPR